LLEKSIQLGSYTSTTGDYRFQLLATLT